MLAPSLKRAMSTSMSSRTAEAASYSTTLGLPRRFSAYDKPISTRPNIPSRPVSDLFPRTSEPVVRFTEPEADPGAMSEDGRSVSSTSSKTTAGSRRRRRKSTRTSVAYHIAHPAPTLTQKQRLLQIRPKLLLQLQQLSADSRPKPALDVLPSTVVVPRLAKKFPRMFRGKAELGVNDVMVVKSEEYNTSDDHVENDSESDEEGLGNRELMAVICQMRKDCGGSQGRAEIVLSDGSVWVATPLPNGLYEFTTVNERGNAVTARWVKRSSRRSTAGVVENPVANNEFKFAFSIIDPNSRRHPIMASLTQSTLDIPDSYISVSSSAGKCPPTSPIRGFPGDPDWQAPADELDSERTSHSLDENMKKLIQVTGIWVALRQGLSPYFKYNDAIASGSNPSPVQRNGSVGSRVRSMAGTGEAGRASPAGSDSTFGSKILSKCVKASPSSNASTQREHGMPKRSVSTGSAFMQRAAARRTGILPSTVASESEGEGIFSPPKRASTLEAAGSPGKELSTPQHRSFPGSSASPMETPTKPQRRSKSVYVTNGVSQERPSTSNERSSMDFAERESLNSAEKPKAGGRWKAFRDFFRRSQTRSG
jgi:hypothetical protein